MEGLVLFAAGFAGLAWVAIRPEWGAPYFASLIYLRLSDSLRGEFGLPSMFMVVAPALVLLAFGRWLATGTGVGRGWKPAACLLLVYGAVCTASLMYAANPASTGDELMNYLDGVFIVLVMTLYLRTPLDLDRTLWALLCGGFVLASLSVYQQLTGSYDQNFAGLARAGLRNVFDANSGFRSEGPVSANYFALVLVIAVPLAVDRLLHERPLVLRALGAATVVLAVMAIAYTYSRGGVVALAGATIPMAFFWIPKRHRFRAFAAVCIVAVVSAAALAPTKYGQRLAALGQVAGLVKGEIPSESSLRGRVSEMTSALMMFADHPTIGVGYGNYEDHYHRYARELGLDGRREERQAHSLYLEVAAETGFMGIVAFAFLLAYPLAGLKRSHEALHAAGRFRDAGLVLAFGLSLLGYLVGSLFLHLSFPRYFWLLVGIALAVGAFSQPQRAASLAPARAAS